MKASVLSSVAVVGLMFTSLGCGRASQAPGLSPDGVRLAPAVVDSRPPEEIRRHFAQLQVRNHALVQELASHYYVYGLEGLDLTRVRGFESWFSYSIETRARIEDMIKEIVTNSESMMADALALGHPEMAVAARDEEIRAQRLITSLEAYKSHDHNRTHLHEAKH